MRLPGEETAKPDSASRMKRTSQSVRILGIHGLFLAILVVIYSQNLIFSPKDHLPGNAALSDITFNFFMWQEQLSIVRDGLLPLGTFWIRSYYGGFAAGTAPHNGLADLPNTISMLLLALTGDHIATVRMMIVGTLLISALGSYLYGHAVTARKDTALVFSVAYTFNVQLFTDIYYGHLNLLVAYSLLPLVFLVWQDFLTTQHWRKSFLAAFMLFLMFLTEYQVLYFTLLGLGCIVIIKVYRVKRSEDYAGRASRLLAWSFFSLVTFALMAAPFSATFLFTRTHLWSVASLEGINASGIFLRPSVSALQSEAEIHYQYVGLLLLLLMMFPLFISKRRRLTKLMDVYLVHVSLSLFYLLFSAAHSAPFSPSLLLAFVFPFLRGVRVVGRAVVLFYLGVSLCASVGYLELEDYVKTRLNNRRSVVSGQILARRSFGKLRKLFGSCTGRTLLPVLLSFLVFLDLTYGFRPQATPLYKPAGLSYEFVTQQRGDFRMIEAPQFWGLATITQSFTKHEVLDYRPLFLKKETDFMVFHRQFEQLPSLLHVQDGDLAGRLGSGWKTRTSHNANLSVRESETGDSPRRASLVVELPAKGDSLLELYQDLDSKKALTEATHLALSLLLAPEGGITVDVTLQLEAKDRICTLVYRVGENMESDSCFVGGNVIAIKVVSGEWVSIRRNLTCDFPDLAVRPEDWFLRQIRVTVRPEQTGHDRRLTVFLDYVTVYEHSNLAMKSTVLGVRYVLVHTDPEYFKDWNASLTGDLNNALRILLYLKAVGDFREVYFDGRIHVMENLGYRGLVFAVRDCVDENQVRLEPARARVRYLWKSPIAMDVLVEAQERCLVALSQNFDEGWSAFEGSTKVEYSPFMGISGFYVEPGNHTVELRFAQYVDSLSTYPLFMVTLAVILFLVARLTTCYRTRRLSAKPVIVAFSWGIFLMLYPVFRLDIVGDRVLTYSVRQSPYGAMISTLGILLTAISAGAVLLLDQRGAGAASAVVDFPVSMSRCVVRKVASTLQATDVTVRFVKCALAGLACCLISASLLFTRIGEYWVNGTLVGRTAWLTDRSKLLAVLSMIPLLANLFLSSRKEKNTSELLLARVGVVLSVFLIFGLIYREHVVIPYPYVISELSVIVVAVFTVSSLEIAHCIQRRTVTMRWRRMPITETRLLQFSAFLCIILSVAATIASFAGRPVTLVISAAAFCCFVAASGLHLLGTISRGVKSSESWP